jgi:hypothetical protein
VFREAATVPVFWALFFTFLICGASTNGLIQTHFVSMCGDFGIVPVAAAGILAMMGIFDLFGTIAVFYGPDWIATVPPTLKLTIKRFGPRKANIVFGWVFAGHQLGAAAAAYGAGLARTEIGSYFPAFLTAGVLCTLAAALILVARADNSNLSLLRHSF